LVHESFSLLLFGRAEQAMRRAEQAVSLARQSNNPDCLHWSLHGLGRVLAVSDPFAACQAFEEAMDAARRTGSRFNFSLDLQEWARLRRRLGDLQGAAQGLLGLLDLLGGAGNRSQLALTLQEAARVLADVGELEVAFILLQAKSGLPELPRGALDASADEGFVDLLEKGVESTAPRLIVRAQSIPAHDLIIMCRASLERLIQTGSQRTSGVSSRRLEDVVVVCTDLVASTELNVRVGDRAYVELLHEHNEITRRQLLGCDGTEFAHTGDGIAAMFHDAGEAVRFAVGLQAHFDDANESHPDTCLLVRVGVARGEAQLDQGNLFGQTVTRAVRICAAATGGQVLAGEEVTEGLDAEAISSSPVGTFPLKGFGISVPLFELRRE
jgi:class 3 adenylate cyclase